MKRLAIFLTPFLLSACAQDVFNTEPEVRIDPDKIKSRTVTLTDPDAGSHADMTIDGKLVIRLDANPTTGIWWSDPVYDESVLDLVSKEYIADPAPAGIVGSGGTTVMTFRALTSGTTRITSEYSRGGGEVYDALNIEIGVSE